MQSDSISRSAAISCVADKSATLFPTIKEKNIKKFLKVFFYLWILIASYGLLKQSINGIVVDVYSICKCLTTSQPT